MEGRKDNTVSIEKRLGYDWTKEGSLEASPEYNWVRGSKIFDYLGDGGIDLLRHHLARARGPHPNAQQILADDVEVALDRKKRRVAGVVISYRAGRGVEEYVVPGTVVGMLEHASPEAPELYRALMGDLDRLHQEVPVDKLKRYSVVKATNTSAEKALRELKSSGRIELGSL